MKISFDDMVYVQRGDLLCGDGDMAGEMHQCYARRIMSTIEEILCSGMNFSLRGFTEVLKNRFIAIDDRGSGPRSFYLEIKMVLVFTLGGVAHKIEVRGPNNESLGYPLWRHGTDQRKHKEVAREFIELVLATLKQFTDGVKGQSEMLCGLVEDMQKQSHAAVMKLGAS